MLVIICQGKSCTKNGAQKVLAAFQRCEVDGLEIRTKFCFGKCGNGPMVVLLPEEIWYERVSPKDVPWIVNNLS